MEANIVASIFFEKMLQKLFIFLNGSSMTEQIGVEFSKKTGIGMFTEWREKFIDDFAWQ